MERRLAAILFTDIVGYTALMGRDEAAGRRVRARHESLVRTLVTRYHGRWIEEKGDESLSIFPSALDAANCALAIQTALGDDAELTLRIGIHLGDVTVEDGRVFGDGVNVAARIRALAEPGGVCVSHPVHDSIKSQPNLEDTALGERELKGVAAPVTVYSVTGTAAEPAPQPRTERETPSRQSAALAVAAIGILALLGTLAIALFAPDRFVWTGSDPPPGSDMRSVAAIPFENLSGDEANVPFTRGVHDDLMTQLSKIASIKTISRRSVLQYRDTTKTIPEIASELGVATILAGGVQRSGDRIRINVRLIDAATDRPLWADTYDRQLSATNVFAIQSEIATSIAEALQATLTTGEQQRLAVVPTRNLEALDSYFLGKQLLEDRNVRSLQAAVAYFEKVIELDPDFALAWSGLADAYLILPEYSTTVDLELVREKSVAAATRALELDPEIPEVLASMAWNRLIHDYDWREAEAILRRALAIHSNNTSALHWLSHVLSWQGEHTEAIRRAKRAVEVDPLSRLMHMNLSYIYMDAGDFEKSIRIADEVWKRYPRYWEQMGNLFLTHLRAGRPADAATAMQLWAAGTGRDLEATDQLGRLFIRHDQGEPVQLTPDLLERMQFVL
ncbi:MAG: tetratricopeptide repeat protein, partial [Chloroflexi bacterium]|nr:tetratricopeptide repeat protein [Chloroflexota bacterium]